MQLTAPRTPVLVNQAVSLGTAEQFAGSVPDDILASAVGAVSAGRVRGNS